MHHSCNATSDSDHPIVHNSRGSMLKLHKDKEGGVRVPYEHGVAFASL